MGRRDVCCSGRPGSNDYDGTKLALGGPGGVESVVVTLNYRLGVLGIFSHPSIDSEGHPWGNYTTPDQQAALRWVQRNIQAFGGDAGKVAIGGPRMREILMAPATLLGDVRDGRWSDGGRVRGLTRTNSRILKAKGIISR